MSRMRQVPVLDVQQQERYLGQSAPQPRNQQPGVPGYPNSNYHYSHYHNNASNNYNNNYNSNYNNSRSRRPINIAPKFRLSEAPDLISNGCSSIREFCTGIQSITIDLNNLLSSVESILPLLTTYLATVQAKNSVPPEEEKKEKRPSIDVYPVQEATAAPAQQPKMPSMPGPEDIQQLLESPLVKNILASFMQNNHHTPS